MKKIVLSAVVGIALFGVLIHGQAPQGRGRGQARGQTGIAPAPAARGGPADPLYKLEDAFLQWPLAAADRAYGAIDGHKLHQVVADFTAISRHYRDQGHPQFWGRVIGSAADEENQQYLLNRFKQIGLSDVHVQAFDLQPQW